MQLVRVSPSLAMPLLPRAHMRKLRSTADESGPLNTSRPITSPGRPVSFTSWLNARENASRSDCSVSRASTLRPVYALSAVPALVRTVSTLGPSATLFSETSPRSTTMVGLRWRRAVEVSTSAQNCRYDAAERSRPDVPKLCTIDRQRRPVGVPAICHWYAPVCPLSAPPIASG